MEQLVEGYWQQWQILKILIFGIGLFLVIRILFKALRLLSVRYKSDFGYKRYFPILEMVIWLSFIYWSLEQLFNEPLYFSVFFITISVIGLLWIGWFGVRDYIAGIVLRAQDVYDKGHQITVGKIMGTISKLGYLSIEVEKQDGSVLKIPYSKITSRIHLNKNVDKIVLSNKINLRIPKGKLISGEIEKLRKMILNSPWHASYIEPKITKVSEDSNFSDLEIIVSTVGKNSREKLQLSLLKFYENNIKEITNGPGEI